MEKALNVDIRQFYREDLGVHSEELLDKLEAVSQAVTLQKGEILNKKGERQTMLPFLIEGMMRCVTLDSEGKEKTVTYRQLFASKLQLQAMLSYYRTYGLLDDEE